MARVPIRDPMAAPVVARDDHLPPVPVALLEPHALRARFARGPEPKPVFPGDGGRTWRPEELRSAAVLVPLVARDHGLSVLLTRRNEQLRQHGGQISFPGGRAEPTDPDITATALRETAEEVGLAAANIEVLGHLPQYTTVTRYAVTPVVGLVTPPFDLALDAQEVAEAFEVPLPFLMNPAHHQRHEFEYEGETRRFISMPWQGEGSMGVERSFFIWGATASMLRNLYHFLQD